MKTFCAIKDIGTTLASKSHIYILIFRSINATENSGVM